MGGRQVGKTLLVIASSFYCETTIMGMAIMKIKKRLDHLLQIGSHEILGVGELGGQFQFSLPLSPVKSCCLLRYDRLSL